MRNARLASGAGYTSVRLSGAAVRTETLRLAGKYDDVVIDTGGRDTASQRVALSVSDGLLVPVVPRSFDVWTLEQVSALVGEMRSVNPELVALAFVNRADPRGGDNLAAEALVRESAELELLPSRLGSRKVFVNAVSLGLAVVEL